MDFTEQIEKTITAMAKGERGEQIARIYRRYFSIVNFAIVYAFGWLLYVALGFNAVVAVLAMLLWNWVMTVGPAGYLWGFKSKPEKKQAEAKKE